MQGLYGYAPSVIPYAQQRPYLVILIYRGAPPTPAVGRCGPPKPLVILMVSKCQPVLVSSRSLHDFTSKVLRQG